MLLSEVISFVNQALRYKMTQAQIALVVDTVQRMAFDRNCEQFLVWSNTLSPQYYIEATSSDYTPGISTDVGEVVTGSSSGATGTIVSYDNSTRKVLLTTSDTFTDGEAFTSTGTIAGTLVSTDAQSGYKGPYTAPSDPPCRKLWGVTTETDTRIFGSEDNLTFPMQDFDFQPRIYDPTRLFKAGRANDVDLTFTFVDEPALPDAGLTYRWVYWRNPPRIDTDDNATLLIPETYHMNLVNACILYAQVSILGETVPPATLATFFQPWWSTLSRPYTPMGKASNQTLNPRGRSDSFL